MLDCRLASVVRVPDTLLKGPPPDLRLKAFSVGPKLVPAPRLMPAGRQSGRGRARHSVAEKDLQLPAVNHVTMTVSRLHHRLPICSFRSSYTRAVSVQ